MPPSLWEGRAVTVGDTLGEGLFVAGSRLLKGRVVSPTALNPPRSQSKDCSRPSQREGDFFLALRKTLAAIKKVDLKSRKISSIRRNKKQVQRQFCQQEYFFLENHRIDLDLLLRRL